MLVYCGDALDRMRSLYHLSGLKLDLMPYFEESDPCSALLVYQRQSPLRIILHPFLCLQVLTVFCYAEGERWHESSAFGCADLAGIDKIQEFFVPRKG